MAPRRAVALLVLAALLAGCTGRDTTAPATPTTSPTVEEAAETLRWALVDDPTSLDPSRVVRRGELAIVDALFDSLTRLTPGGVAVPSLASSWEVDDDATTFTFALDPAARWHDGRTVVADDVVRGLTRVADATGPRPSLHASLLRDVVGFAAARRGAALAGVTAVGDDTVVVRTTQPTPQLPLLLAHPALAPAPPEAATDQAAFAEAPVGNGPFVLSEWLRNQFLRLVPAESSTTEPAVGELVFRVYRDDVDGEVRWADLVAGQVQVADVPTPRLDELDGIRLASEVDLTSVLLVSTRRPLLRDPDVRRGLSLLLDRDATASRTNGARTAAEALVPGGLLGSQVSPCDTCGHQPAQGGDLVRAGVERVRAATGGRPAPLTLVTTDDALSVAVADQLAAALLTDGVIVRVDPVDPLELAETIEVEGPDLVLLPWTSVGPTSETFLRDLLAPGALPDTVTAWRPQQLEEHLARVTTTADETARVDAVHELERYVLGEAVVVPVHHGRAPLGVSSDVIGFQVAADGSVDLTRVRIGGDG